MAGGLKQVRACRGLIACAAAVLIVAVLAFWYAGATVPAIQVRFLSLTKENFMFPGTYRANIQLENNLQEPVVIRQVFVEERNSNKWMAPRPVSFSYPMAPGAKASMPAFPSLSTNTFGCGIPEQPGLYRLHVSCFSDRNIPQGPALALRCRLANLVYWLAPPWGSAAKPVNVGLWRLVCRIQGGRCVTSEPFKPVALEDLIQQAASGLGPAGAAGVNGPVGAGGGVEGGRR